MLLNEISNCNRLTIIRVVYLQSLLNILVVSNQCGSDRLQTYLTFKLYNCYLNCQTKDSVEVNQIVELFGENCKLWLIKISIIKNLRTR